VEEKQMAIRSLLKLPVVGYESEEAFLKDLRDMVELARKQPGFISVEVWKAPDLTDPVTYLVESEWETRVAMSAMEHHPDHDEMMARYPHKPVHLRLVPWIRPA
jgi:heme-degrading monooxygenase HmoA